MRPGSVNGLGTESSERVHEVRVNECVICSSSEWGLKKTSTIMMLSNKTDKSGNF
jgi:hypothetical protein